MYYSIKTNIKTGGMKNRILITLLFIGTLSQYNAQKDYYGDAELAFLNEKYFTAVEVYKKAEAKVKKVELKAKINYKIGLCYENMQETEQAETYYKRALKLKHDLFDPKVKYHLGLMYMEQGMYTEAQLELESYLLKVGDDELALKHLESCIKSHEWKSNPTEYVISSEIQLNTQAYDWAVTWADKRKNTVVFSSTREGNVGDEIDDNNGQAYCDLWTSFRDNKGKWGEPVLLPNTINTKDNEGAGVFNSKMNKLYFTRCKREKKKNIGCSIFYSEKQGSSWKNAQEIMLKPEGGDSISMGHPAISRDEMLLVFSSDLPGGFGGKDLYYSKYNKREKSWGEPVNLGPSINTKGDDIFPTLMDNGDLYFSSDGYIGMGGVDIFKATKTAAFTWENPENLQYPINSPKDDFGITFEGNDNKRGMLTSDRAGGKGKDDLYSFYLPEKIYALECYVTDRSTGERIPNVKLELIGEDGSLFTKYTNENGKFVFDKYEKKRYLAADKNYIVKAEKEGYGGADAKITTIGFEKSTGFIEEFFLYKGGVIYEFPEVRYDYNDTALQVIETQINSKDSLDHLYNLLIENEGWVIELQAHTDCRGSLDYNDKLSNGRANSCVEYLVSKGIDKRRLVPKGYGERVPRETLECETIEAMNTEEEKEAAHQRNRRTQFVILSFDFKE